MLQNPVPFSKTSAIEHQLRPMKILSEITSQGQVLVPAAVRQAFGVGPGEVLEWVEENGRITVQRATRHTAEAVHRALFPLGSETTPKTLGDLKQVVRELMQRRHR